MLQFGKIQNMYLMSDDGRPSKKLIIENIHRIMATVLAINAINKNLKILNKKIESFFFL
jgi:hypothetical protein